MQEDGPPYRSAMTVQLQQQAGGASGSASQKSSAASVTAASQRASMLAAANRSQNYLGASPLPPPTPPGKNRDY